MRNRVFKIMAALLAMPLYAMSQASIDYNEVTDELKKGTKAIITGSEIIVAAVLAIGLVTAVYQVVTGKHESRERIIGFAVGLIVYIIGITIINRFIM